MRAALIGFDGIVALLVAVSVVISYCWSTTQACLAEEREALLQIKHSIHQRNGSALSGWVGEECCKWEGILCNESTHRVISMDLSGKGHVMNGAGPWHPNVTLFAQFRELEGINLQSNQIGGWIMPQSRELLTMKHLHSLNLHDNLMEESHCIRPWRMPSLKNLIVSSNKFRDIPHSLGDMHSLQYLNLSSNQLRVISFSTFSKLSQLFHLKMSDNPLVEIETVPPTWVPPFQLIGLDLSNCNLNHIPNFIFTQYDLRHLDMSRNSLEGNIPSQFFYNSNITNLNLARNRFSGPFPLPHGNITSKLGDLDISDNDIHGSLPRKFDSVFPDLDYLVVSNNTLQGHIPQSIGKVGDLTILLLDNNNFIGEIPPLNNKTVVLDLSNNNLEGEMLPKNFILPDLWILMLCGNSLAGTIPSTLSNSTFLTYLDLRDNILSSNIADVVPDVPVLELLLLGGNNFQGNIPKTLCRMQNIRLLDLSRNQLFGTIPTCLANISFRGKSGSSYFTFDFTTKGMSLPYTGSPSTLINGIDLSSNNLTGNIPLEIGTVKILYSLNLSRNLLTGQIPVSFKNLENLESLDLSRNKLSGKIPLEMIELNSLSVLDVSFNDLLGEIPYEGQFTTFSENSFMGNPGLCGLPLHINCSIITPSEPLDKKEEGKSGLLENNLFFYSYVFICYALGFWGSIIVLIFKKNWRISYFRAMDNCFDFCQVKLSGFLCYLKDKYC